MVDHSHIAPLTPRPLAWIPIMPVKPRPLAWIPTDLIEEYVYLREKKKSEAVPVFIVEDYISLRKKNPTEHTEILADMANLDEKIAHKIDDVLG